MDLPCRNPCGYEAGAVSTGCGGTGHADIVAKFRKYGGKGSLTETIYLYILQKLELHPYDSFAAFRSLTK